MQKDQEYLNELQREKYELWSLPDSDHTPTEIAFRPKAALRAPAPGVIVAEGDSWFDYPVGRDVLHQLKRLFNYRIARVSDAGDTLENMVYGTEIDWNFRPKSPSWWQTKQLLERHKPRIFLFSGGGNDFAGPELESLLNHAFSGLPPLREEVVRFVLHTAARTAFLSLCQRVWQSSPSTQIVLHGYGVPIPDGRAVSFLVRFAGPWLRPYLAKKGILDPVVAQDVMETLVTQFNAMLEEVAATDERIHYLNLLETIDRGDWENELHLDDDGYAKVAGVFHDKIQALGGA